MNFNLEQVNCNICGIDNTTFFARVSYNEYLNRRFELKNKENSIKDENLANYKFSLVRCKSCGLIYINPRLSAKDLSQLYGDNYFLNYSDTNLSAHKMRQKTFRGEIIELERLVKKAGINRKILDVGCSGGFFLAGLDDSWDKYGVEINPHAVKYAKEYFHLNVAEGKLSEMNFPASSFDVIKMRGVIEHLSDPAGELRESYKLLSKGGIVGINTMNMDSICARIYKEKFRLVSPTQHIYYFSTKTLAHMLEKIGFKIIRIFYHYFDTPYASFKDPLKILSDIISLRIFRDPNTVSPPFYGNVVDMYAVKK